jgi:type II secretory pathway pseudopilin PulG
MLIRTIGNKGVTLIENLIGILLLSSFLTGIMGTYYLSLSSVNRGKHVATANSILQSHIEQEMRSGYNDSGGSFGGSYYITMPLSTAGSKSVTIDDRGTIDDISDDLMGALTCYPWYPANIQAPLGGDLLFDGVRYKIAGFVISWAEKAPFAGQSRTCSVRAATYICER